MHAVKAEILKMSTNLESPHFPANVLWYLLEISFSLLYFSFPLKRVKRDKKTTMLTDLPGCVDMSFIYTLYSPSRISRFCDHRHWYKSELCDNMRSVLFFWITTDLSQFTLCEFTQQALHQSPLRFTCIKCTVDRKSNFIWCFYKIVYKSKFYWP